MKLIDKDIILDKIEKIMAECFGKTTNFVTAKKMLLTELKHFVNTIETKNVDFWHKQSEEDILYSMNDWNLHTFVCLMKDGSLRTFTGNMDESQDGNINTYINCVDDYDWEYDDIAYWTELPNIKA